MNERKVTRKVTFYKESLVMKRIKGEREILFKEIKSIKYIKCTFFNWITSWTHGLMPGRVFIFLKEKGFQRWYSFRIPNGVFQSLPVEFTRKLDDAYRQGYEL